MGIFVWLLQVGTEQLDAVRAMPSDELKAFTSRPDIKTLTFDLDQNVRMKAGEGFALAMRLAMASRALFVPSWLQAPAAGSEDANRLDMDKSWEVLNVLFAG